MKHGSKMFTKNSKSSFIIVGRNFDIHLIILTNPIPKHAFSLVIDGEVTYLKINAISSISKL